MSRPATGTVVERDGKRGRVYALRFRALGERRYVTTTATVGEHVRELGLRFRSRGVRRGLWRPRTTVDVVQAATVEPTFHVYANEWVERRRHEVAERTVEDWEYLLSCHLLEFFHSYRPSQITGRMVKTYKAGKVRERAEIDAAHTRQGASRRAGTG